MKTKITLMLIMPLMLAVASCSSSLYTASEYDDLYYISSDEPQRVVAQQAEGYANRQAAENAVPADTLSMSKADTLQADRYYGNTLVEKGDEEVIEYYENNPFDYYNRSSYAGRINRFHGNYGTGFGYYSPFYDPFADPFYSYSRPYYSNSRYYDRYRYDYYGYGMPHHYGNPYFANSFYYGYPYSSYGMGYHTGYYTGMYSGLFYPGWYSSNYYSGGYYAADNRYVNTRSRPRAGAPATNRRLTTSVPGSKSTGQTVTSSRRATSAGSRSEDIRAVSRRNVQAGENRTTGRTADPVNRRVSTNNRSSDIKPVYKNANRSAVGTTNRRTVVESIPRYNPREKGYQPTYTRPRMTTKPVYNSRSSTARRISTNSRSTLRRSTPVKRSTITMPVRRSSSSGNYSRSSSTIRRSSSSRSTTMRSTSTKSRSSSSRSSSSGRRSSSSSGRRR